MVTINKHYFNLAYSSNLIFRYDACSMHKTIYYIMLLLIFDFDLIFENVFEYSFVFISLYLLHLGRPIPRWLYSFIR